MIVSGGKKKTAEKSVQLREYQLGFLQTLKRSQFKFQRQHVMRPAGGLTEQQRNAKAGTWCSKEGITWQMASTEPKISLSYSIASSITRLLLTYHQTVSVFLLSLLYKNSQAILLVCWKTKCENQSEWH